MGRTQRVLGVVVGVALLGTVGCRDDGPELAVSESPERESGAVRPGRANWSTGYFQSAVYAQLLEELGFEVGDPSAHEYPPAEGYMAMAEGRFDYWPNGWYDQHYRWHSEELADGTKVADRVQVVGEQLPGGGKDGLLITKSIAVEYGIESLDQIDGDLELVALFDTDGDGLAEVRGCEDGWTCDDIMREMIEDNEWSNLELVTAGYSGLLASTIERVERGEPVIQYVWSPSGPLLTDLVPGESVLWLSLGGNEHVIDEFADADPYPDVELCTDDPCWLGWEVSDIRVTVNNEFAAANPVAVALFEQVELTVPDIMAANVRFDEGENTNADVERHAAEWIADHRDLVDEWLALATAQAES